MPSTKDTGRYTSQSGRGRRRRAAGISELFAGRAITPLLRTFFLHPSRDFYQRELADLAGERLFLVQGALKRLVNSGFVEETSRGNRTYYRVNQAHPAFQDMKAVVLKTVGFGDALREQLQKLQGRVRVAFVYGSVARGEETGSSDVDVMLIGDVSVRDLASVLAPVKRLLSREINASLYTPSEFRKKFRAGHPFVQEVIRSPKIFLLGDERELKGVLSGR